MIFGLFNKNPKAKRSYPRINPEMIQPVGEPLSTTDAKAVFKSYIVQIGFLDKDKPDGCAVRIRPDGSTAPAEAR